MIVKVVKPKTDPNAGWLVHQKDNVGPKIVLQGALGGTVCDYVVKLGGWAYFNATFDKGVYAVGTPVQGEAW